MLHLCAPYAGHRAWIPRLHHQQRASGGKMTARLRELCCRCRRRRPRVRGVESWRASPLGFPPAASASSGASASTPRRPGGRRRGGMRAPRPRMQRPRFSAARRGAALALLGAAVACFARGAAFTAPPGAALRAARAVRPSLREDAGACGRPGCGAPSGPGAEAARGVLAALVALAVAAGASPAASAISETSNPLVPAGPGDGIRTTGSSKDLATAVAVLGVAAVALRRWGAAQAPADAGEGPDEELLPEKAPGSSSTAER
ncbi:unnamed protein product [Prorocentrum cordatum]|uniref:Uncharacterized protein n=1 Tax=Prorocentrum cordatum TaxID=2364126 RepID=A0ABN9UIW1_9DINO|nr:unnamed protein product [Polarella glacialis]